MANFVPMDRFWKYKLDHLLFWLLTVGFHAYTHSYLIAKAGPGQFIIELVVRDGLLALVIYGHGYILIPDLFRQKRYFAYAAGTVVLLGFYVLCKNLHDSYLFGQVMSIAGKPGVKEGSYYNFSIVLFYFTFSIALQLSKEWYFQTRLLRKIELERLNTELEYLKSQINPHFLFNSINTVYFQIDKANTLARESLARFSDMLRYQLYECNGREVPIEKEITYLGNYIELQKLRKGESHSVELTVSPDLGRFALAPLMLIVFVENAFKHVSHHRTEANIIRVSLSRTGDVFEASVFNTRTVTENRGDYGGIGLKNVRRRLELLYPGRHDLAVTERPGSFEVSLKLKIA
jgi:hypothetical protein